MSGPAQDQVVARERARQAQAGDAAQILAVKRLTLNFQDRLITDTLEARLRRPPGGYAEPFQARGPLLVSDPTAFAKVPFG